MAYLQSLSGAETPPSKEQLEKSYLPEIDPAFVRETETLVSTALLMGMDHARNRLDMADTEIPPLPFEEAVAFMKSRVPVTKAEWNALEPKLRFRAFTVARLAQLDYIDAARQVLAKALETGKGTAETYKQWRSLQTLVRDDAMRLRPGYWENVFRTNTQTAYVAGKLMQFQNNPPPAWRLLIVDDSRTSDICRGLIREGKDDLVMASEHPFWKTFGFPPYHYQCRTGLQAVYQSQIDHGVQVENPSIKNLRGQFKPMKGFGGNPIKKESWWKLTPEMLKRAEKYGIADAIADLKNRLGLGDPVVAPSNKSTAQLKTESGIIDEERVSKTLHAQEEAIKNLDYERGVIVDMKGTVINTTEGRTGSVAPPAHLIKDSIFTHNHPSGGCALSLDDVRSIIADDGYEVRAVTRDGRFVSLKKGAGKIDTTLGESMQKAGLNGSTLLMKAERNIMQKYGPKARYQDKSWSFKVRMEAEAIVNRWLADNAPKYGYVFTQGKI